MPELLTVAVIFAPGGYILARHVFLTHMFKNKEPGKHEILLGRLWTYIMLFIHFGQGRRLSADHEEASQNLRSILSDRDAEAMYLMPESRPCDRYSDDYAGLVEVSGQ